MYVTPESGPNLMYWNFLPMGVTNYGGDLQIFNLPEYTAAPLQFNLNPIGLEYVRTSAFQGIGGGWSPAQVDVNAVNALTQQFVAPVLQQNAAQHYTQAGQGVTALKTSLNSLLINPNATTEDREKANEYLAKIDKLEAELKALEGQELSAKEVYDKSSAIEKELRQIATSVGELNSKISKAATEAAQQAQQAKQQAATEQQGANENGNSATVKVQNADPEAERLSQT